MLASKILEFCDKIDESCCGEIQKPTIGQLENAIKPLADLLIDVKIDDDGIRAEYKVSMLPELEKRIKSSSVLNSALESMDGNVAYFLAATPTESSEEDDE
ncbi:hypothetical protein [Vibrio phage Va2]|nr:hypothetical protein [Vibrio phage Va2]